MPYSTRNVMHPLSKFRYCPACGSGHFVENTDKSKRCQNCHFEYFMNPSSATAAFIFNGKGELLVLKRKIEPAKGMYDLPGGFTDIGETAEEGMAREIMEETGLTTTAMQYLFSLPNIYRYSGVDVRTLDLFFRCEVADDSVVRPDDDASEYLWIAPSDIRTEQFGLRSIREAIRKFMGENRA